MTEENTPRGNIYSANDPLDINELASLNDDISPEFIEQLQNKVSKNATEFTGRQIIPDKDDTELFEEVSADETNVAKPKFDESIDDNFIKKYKAKINKQQTVVETKEGQETAPNAEPQTISSSDNNTTSKAESSSKKDTVDKAQETPASVETLDKNQASFEITEKDKPNANTDTEIKKDPQGNEEQPKKDLAPATQTANSDIGGLTSGNIIERPATQEQIDYNESLDFLDDNIKYSKYVVYIDPENTEFIESLTVKERKNLINRMLREQDDIAITKRRLGLIHTVIKHSIIAIITLSIAIPVTYWTINTSLEASINNYRRSKTIFKTLYKEKGKIKSKSSY